MRRPVIGNGDVRSRADAEAMVATTGCAGVMIGRGALGAPWIFSPGEVPREERARIVRRHCELIEAHFPPRIATIHLKKHLVWYTHGLPFAAPARPVIFEAPDAESVKTAFWRFWDEVREGAEPA